jgi:NAD-dependent dihydropyrimidine dehydrogenase PreA subunit
MTIKEMAHDTRRLHKVKVNGDICMGCKRCIKTCIYSVYKWDKEKKEPVPAYSEECTACLQCEYYCPSGAINIENAAVAFYDTFYDPFGLNDKAKEA